MVKLLQQVPKKLFEFLHRKSHEWKYGGTVRWYGGYPFYFQDKKANLDTNSIIQACMGWEARNFCEPPGALRTLSSKGTPDLTYDHPLVNLFLRPEPEGKMTGRRLLKALLASRRLDGNGYFDIIPDRTGKPAELRYIPYWAIEPIAAKGSGVLDHYEITLSDGTRQNRDPEAIFHTADGIDDRNPLKGCSALKSAMRFVMTDNEAAAAGQQIMSKLGVIGLFVSPKNGYKIENKNNRDAFAAELNQRFAGEGKGGALVGSGEFDVTYLGVDASKLGFRDLHRIPEERITAIFGYAAIVIGLGAGLDRSTFANFAEAREAATEQTLVPLWAEIADEITVQLGPRFKLKPNESFTYDLKNVKILQEDEDKRWNRVGGAFEKGGITRAEYRTAIGYEASPEDEVYIHDIQSGGEGEAAKNADTAKMMRFLKRRSRQARSDFERIQELEAVE
jgi:HK97 family phage portal protein